MLWIFFPSHRLLANAGTCTFSELIIPMMDTITLLSPDTYCRGGNQTLTVSGTNVRWYADASKKLKLADGNSYHTPKLDKTTTYYLTQTLQGVESPVQAIEIQMVEPFLNDVKVTPASCNEDDGSIFIDASGGTSKNPLVYKINNGPFQTSPIFGSLAGGTYTVTFQIASCWGTKTVFVEQQPAPKILRIDSVAPSCGASHGSMRILADGGTGILSYSLDGIDFQQSSYFDSLDGGQYEIVVRDESLCKTSKSVVISKSIDPQIRSVAVIPTSCGEPNGQVVVKDAIGNGNLTFLLGGNFRQGSATFDSLAAGNFTLVLNDQLGCRDSIAVNIPASEGPKITSLETKQPTCDSNDGKIVVNIGGTSTYLFSINGTDYQQDNNFTGLTSGSYTVMIKDQAGCIVNHLVTLAEPCGTQIFLPSSFSPNNDGKNDTWEVFFPFQSLTVQELTIFNRWGEVVFYDQPGDVQSGRTLWTGTYRGIVLEGLFTYQMRVVVPGGRKYSYRGSLISLH